MLHQGRLASARLTLDPEHAVVGGEVCAVVPFLELVGGEQPVAGVGEGGLDVVLAGVEVGEVEGAEAICAWLLVGVE
jgi:hypothetical protein